MPAQPLSRPRRIVGNTALQRFLTGAMPPAIGTFFHNEDDGKVYQWNGDRWETYFGGDSNPTGLYGDKLSPLRAIFPFLDTGQTFPAIGGGPYPPGTGGQGGGTWNGGTIPVGGYGSGQCGGLGNLAGCGTTAPPPIVNVTALGHGGWTQANRPNGVYHAGHSYIGYMNGANGNVEVVDYNHGTGISTVPFVLHAALQVDTHAAPGLLIRASDNRLMAFYSAHDGPAIFMRISTNPLDATAWDPEVNLTAQIGGSGDYTYMQPLQLTGVVNQPIYLFFRDFFPGPNTGQFSYSVSTDGGTTWAAEVVMIERVGSWVYGWAVATSPTRIDAVFTDGGPSVAVNIRTYHAYLVGGIWHKTDGTQVLGPFPVLPSAFTLAFTPSLGDNAWPWQLAVDSSGYPRFVQQVIYSDNLTNSIRLVSWNGAVWAAHEASVVQILPANAGQSANGGGFSPGCALDPDNPNIVYLLKVGASGKFELFKYLTNDLGVTWSITQLTLASANDNLYPYSPVGAGFNVLMLTGTWTSYLINNLNVVGVT